MDREDSIMNLLSCMYYVHANITVYKIQKETRCSLNSIGQKHAELREQDVRDAF
jgi:hypothetical protein